MRFMDDLFRHDCKAPRPSIRHVRQITSRNVGRRPARVVGGGVVGGARGAALRGAPRAATHVESGFSARVRRRRRRTRAEKPDSRRIAPARPSQTEEALELTRALTARLEELADQTR